MKKVLHFLLIFSLIVGGTFSFQEEARATAWDITTSEFVQSKSLAAQSNAPSQIVFKVDGTKMYMVGANESLIQEYNLSSAWDISSLSFVQATSSGPGETTPRGVFLRADGLRIYFVGATSDRIVQYNLSVAWDVSTAFLAQTFLVSGQETSPAGLYFRADGLKMYVSGFTGDDVNEYDLSVAWDISTAVFLQNRSFGVGEGQVRSHWFKDDGTKFYMTGQDTARVWEFNLSSAWDVSTLTSSTSFDISAKETAPNGITFNLDGDQMFVSGSISDSVHEYSLPDDDENSGQYFSRNGERVIPAKNEYGRKRIIPIGGHGLFR